LAGGGDSVGAERHTALHLAHQANPHAHAIEDEIAVVIGELAAVVGQDRSIQSLGNGTDGGGADGVFDERSQCATGLAGGDPSRKTCFKASLMTGSRR